jgi:hypothetical protein
LEKTVKTPRSKLPALILLLPAWVSAQSLTLSCDGQGSVLTTQSTTANQYDFKHKENRGTGVVHINFANQPKLRIDRMTGKLSMSGGLSDFSADCSAADTSKPKF